MTLERRRRSTLDEPISIYCRPADDLLPSPGACVLTGISPQQAERDGVTEAELAARMVEAMALPGTCVVGYNSLRFDDEFVRHALYRNFHDPYEREWRGGNSRWDLLDLARAAWALRPDGIEWPTHPDGSTSFRLEHLAAANGLLHEQAHDALSDVRATLALAQRIRRAQPKLFDYYLGLRSKQRAARLLDYASMTPVLHVSGRYPARRFCASVVLPVAPHPTISNRVLVCDLEPDPTALKSWRDAPLFWLFVVALVLAIAGVFAMADFSGRHEGIYIAPHEENGRVVPGHFAPGGS